MMSGGVRESLLSGLECENHATIVLDHARVRMWVIHGVLSGVRRRMDPAVVLPVHPNGEGMSLCDHSQNKSYWCSYGAAITSFF